MGFIFGGDTGQSQADVTDARKRLAAAMLQQGTDTSPIQSPWEGAARMAQALMGGLAVKNQANQQKAADAQVIAAITGQPYTPPEQPKGFLSSIFGGGNKSNPGATGSSMPKTDSGGNVALPSTGKEWETIGPRLVGDLSKDFQLSPEQAVGVVGPLGQESAGFGTLQEVNPLIPGSRGGFGYAQWTGPRRKQFEAWSQQNGLDPTSYEANYGFLKHELMNTPEGAVLDELRKAPDAMTAGRVFTDKFLRPGIPNYDSRDAWTKRAMAFANSQAQAPGGNPVAGMPTASPIQPPPVNPPAPPPTPGYVDPMIAPNAATPMPQASAPGEVASLDPSIGIPMPGAAGQMRASDPAQPMPPQGAPQAALSPLPSSTVGPTPNVASVPSVGQEIPPEFQNSQQLMNADPNKGVLQAILGGGSPASPEQVQQAQALGGQSGQARLAQALDNVPQQAQNPMANPRVQALVQAITNPNASPQVKAMAAQSLQTLMKPPEYGFQVLPDGTVLRSDPRSGNLTPVYRSEMSQADQAKIEFEREKFRQEQENRGTLTAADKARIDLERQKSDFERNKPVVVQPGETLFSPGQEKVVYQGTGFKPEDVSSLRKEIQNLPTYKSYQQALPSYSSMIDTAKTDSKASDLNLIYGLGKIMDPNSVVREGEMTLVQNTSSWPDWLKGAYDSVTGGSRLEPATRKAILGEARSRMTAYRGALDNDITQYRGIIGRRGMNEADILPTLGDIAEVPSLTPAPAADVGPAPEGVPADVWGAMTPAERKLWQK
ncbi:phage tail tip lysozyme [Rhizobium sp. WYCCWR 11128]|uniref:phage tail tip lysozyme n=1 Tax=Rhizobium sp. WYCCWR 11128 TaxID=2749832 RepID=UPI0015D2F1A7|nr:phage tail tip lysozyme [Rhizobium sp. WYCCWR 11128]NYT33925.1 hypothetical protein [Rhizobium sp. WYCCWR 11128]